MKMLQKIKCRWHDVVVHWDEDGVWAEVLDLPGCFTQVDLEEWETDLLQRLRANLDGAIRAYEASLVKDN